MGRLYVSTTHLDSLIKTQNTGAAWLTHTPWDSMMCTHPLGNSGIKTAIRIASWTHNHWDSFIYTYPLQILLILLIILILMNTYPLLQLFIDTTTLEESAIHIAIQAAGWAHNDWDSFMYTQSLGHIDVHTASMDNWGTKPLGELNEHIH